VDANRQGQDGNADNGEMIRKTAKKKEKEKERDGRKEEEEEE
jgi:hypothetical protein